MEELTVLIQSGKELGLEGQGLVDWLDAQQKKLVEIEKLRTKTRKEEIKLKEEELEKELKMREELAESESQRKQRELGFELELIREKQRLAEIECKRENLENSMSSKSIGIKAPTPAPKLPPFDSKTDQFDAYIMRFERFATQQDWPESDWASYLCNCLRGEALDVYSRLSPEDAENYSKIKDALFLKYELTSDGFRKKFRTEKKKSQETYMQFLSRIRHYLNRWVELSTSEKTYETFFEVVLQEQFLDDCPDDLKVFIREHKAKTVAQMAELAMTYVEAHQGDGKSFNHTKTQLNRPSNQTICYLCDRVGHIARDCRNRNFSQTQNRANFAQNLFCRLCKRNGHTEDRCYKNKFEREQKGPSVASSVQAKKDYLLSPGGSKVPVLNAFVEREEPNFTDFPHCNGHVNNLPAVIIRDTGCNTVLVRNTLVHANQYTGDYGIFRVATLDVKRAPLAKIYIKSDFFVGEVIALAVQNLVGDVLLGNIPGVNKNCSAGVVNVVTRSQSKATHIKDSSLHVPEFLDTNNTGSTFSFKQQNDPSLKKYWDYAKEDVQKPGKAKFFERDGFLYRLFVSEVEPDGIDQLVIPTSLRSKVLKLGHESLLSGHLGMTKTIHRVTQHFYWPGIMEDVKRYCRSCDTCQRNVTKGSVSKVPLVETPVITQPFERVAIDIVGPIEPASKRGYRYILTLVDMATRYPEAVPLKRIHTEAVAEALLSIFCRLGVPKEILSDRGAQFTSGLMQEISRLLSIKQLYTTPYHPQCNGLVEKFNGTLKSMLKKMCEEEPRDWDRFIEPVLFAYREVPQSSLGFSPFEMIYGHTVRGPLQILREIWENKKGKDDTVTEYEYVLELGEKLEKTWELARKEVCSKKEKATQNYNKRAKRRTLEVGNQVLLLLPTDKNKMILHWKGPFEVVERNNEVNYVININGKRKRFHINMLKHYIPRESEAKVNSVTKCTEDPEDKRNIPTIGLQKNETFLDCKIGEDLDKHSQDEMLAVLEEFSDVLSDIPGATKLTECKLSVKDNDIIRVKPYPIPHQMQHVIDEEVEKMEQLGIIEPSVSDFRSPIVMVKKGDGTHRFCIDYRRLNAATVFDAEPLPNAETIFGRLAKGTFLSKIDLSKGYWQIPLDPASKKYTAFSTGRKSMQFCYMPFGLSCAPAVFSRMMSKLLQGIEGVENYLDDIIIFSQSWNDHLNTLTEVFRRLRDNGLTAKPSKCTFGCNKLEFLGHIVGGGAITVKDETVNTILASSKPRTKKELRSLLGLVNYYRSFIPNFATIVAPLTDLTKQKANVLEWSEREDKSLETIKNFLIEKPILKLPDWTKPFTIRSDASSIGIGAVLLQEHNEKYFPVAYASRKLLDREQKYSSIEREALAIIWSLQKFEHYTYGQLFYLQTDHMPLKYINSSKLANSRVFRWALLLQEHNFVVQNIKSSECLGADFLSRCV